MKRSTLTGIMQKNVISTDLYQSISSFAGNTSNSQNLTANCNYRAKWHYVSLVLLIALGFFMTGASQAFGQITQVTGSPQTNTSTGSSVVINKPTGLAVGDVMIAQVVQSGNGNTIDNATSSGWTQIVGSNIYSQTNDRCRATILYKIAAAGDVASANFTFSFDADADDGEGAIVAFSGVDVTTGPFDVTPGTGYTNFADDNTYTATAITTSTANSAVIMFGAVYNNRTTSGWSTTNPGSLTELYDVDFDATMDIGMGAAWALKSSIGSTGTGTATLSSGDFNGAILIALKAISIPLDLEPTTQATNVTFSSVSATGMTINWTSGNGSNRIVLVKSGSAVNSNPVDGISYTASTTYSNGTQIGTGNYVVYNGTGNSVSITGLTGNTTYYVAVYEFNGTGTAENYLTTGPATGSQATVNPAGFSYRSVQSGNWGDLTTWEEYDGSTWGPANSTPTSANGAITIQNGHTVTVAVNVTVDQVNVAAGGSVIIANGVNLTIANGTGDDFTVDGTLRNGTGTANGAGGTITTTGTLVFNNGGTYQHGYTDTGGLLPVATWNSGSNCEIVGYTTLSGNPPAGTNGFGNLTQPFSNFIWNCPNQTASGNISLGGALNTINDNFTITSTGSGSVALGANAAGNLAISGNFSQTGGTFSGSSAGARTITVSGNFALTGGTFNLSSSGTSGNAVVVNIAGNYTHSSGTLTESGSTNGSGIVFNGGGVQQTFTSGGTVSNTVNFTVNNNSFLQMADESTVVNGNAFTLAAGVKLGIRSADGITTAPTAAGNIRTTARTFTAGANYEYNGTSAQVTGSGLTQNTPANVIINNSGGVSLSASTSISVLLNMSNGTLDLANFNVTTADLSGSGNITNNATGTATLTVNGSGNSTYGGALLNGSSPTDMITALTKSGSGSLTLTNSAFTFTGSTTITAGDLILNPVNTTATFDSPVVLNGGTLSTTGIASGTTFTSSSTLELNTSSSIDLGSNVHSLVFAPSSGITWAGTALTINGWIGGYGVSGTHGQIFFGNITGLNENKLAKISFTGYPGTATLIGSGGELVPTQITGPVLSVSGTNDHGSACVNAPAASIIYTITNNGSTADGITVTSNNPEFVVSGLSSTTITGGGGTATYQVTFTPVSIGPRSATITIESTTPNSNSPTSSLTGEGVEPPTASAGGSDIICPAGTATVSGASASGGSILWTEDGAGTITSGSTGLTPTYTSAAGDAGNLVTLTMTVSNGLCAPAIDYYTVTVRPFPTADAGPDQSTCAGGTIILAGSIGGGATSSTWSAPTGSFGDPSSLTSTYTPSITSGTVVLTLTANDPTCTGTSSTMTVTVNPLPVAVGETICQYGNSVTGLTSSSCSSPGPTDAGPNYPGTGASVNGPGSTAWSGFDNITAGDLNYATAILPNNGDKTSDYLQSTNFGFNIPTGATINGIQVYIMRQSSSSGGNNSVNDVDLYLLKAGSSVGNDHAVSTDWPTTMSLATYGGTSDLWGTTWTPADINNTNFGVRLSAYNQSTQSSRTASVDYFQITITYTTNNTTYWYTMLSGGTPVQSGASFNPVGDPEVIAAGAPYDLLNNSNTSGTYTFYAECSNNSGCRAAVNFVINPAPSTPTITPIGPIELCTTTGVPVTLQSSSATGNQWYRNAVLLGGETNQILTVSQAGDYTVTVTDGTCTSLPSAATTVVSITPEIIIDPAATATCFNGTGTEVSSLHYTSVLNNPISYSITWNASPPNSFAPVTDALLPVSPINLTVPAGTAPGTYTGNLTVKRADNCVSISTPFTLTVNPNPVATFSYPAPSYCTNNITNPTPSFSGGGVAGTFTSVPGGLTLDSGTGVITLGTSLPGPYTVTNTVISNGCTTVYNVPLIILNQPTVTISYGSPFCNTITTPQSVTRLLTNGTTYASGSYSAEPAGLSINSLNDAGNPLSPAGQIIPSESLPGTYTVTYTFTNGVCSNTQTTEVIITAPPAITIQPVAPAPVCLLDGTGTISVTATGADLTYQWRKGGTPLTEGQLGWYTGVNTSTLTITNPGISENGALFDAVVSGSCSPSTISNSVALTIITAPNIEDQPVTPAAMCAGNGAATISVTATGYGLTYQWRKNFTPLTDDATYQNVTTATLTITNPGESENGAIYDVVVTGACNPVLTSGIAGPIIVNPSPESFDVTGSAISCAQNPSSDISLSGSQNGINYQLKNSSDDSDIGTPVPGDGNAIILPTGPVTSTTTIYVLATDPVTLCSTMMAGTAVITVIPEIGNNIISSSPSVCVGSSPDPLMGATPTGGDGDYYYVWQSSTDNITFVNADGINDNQNYLPDPLTNDTWFRRLITSGPCTSISNSVQITINPLPAIVDVTPATAQFCSSLMLTASNGGDGTIYYQGTNPVGTRTDLGGSPQTVNASGTYYFRAFNRNTLCWGPAGSSTVILSLPPSTLSTTICEGGSGTLISAAACPSTTSVVPNYPGTGADNAGTGSVIWGNPGNIVTAGTPYSIASNMPAGGSITHYLMATNYNFNVPADATINGIIVTINRESSGSSSPNLRDNIVRLIRGGTITGSNRAKLTTDWPATMGSTDYGNIIDTWGITGITPADINSPDFGVALSAVNNATSTYPVVAGSTTSIEGENTNSHDVALPSGITAGDLLLIFWSNRERDNINVTTPTGWTLLYQSSNFNEARRIAWYKIADGTEGTSLTINSFGSGQGIRSAHNSYRIAAGTYEGIPTAGTPATSNGSTAPNPPNHVSGFGTTNTLWIAASHSLGASSVTAPASYSNLIQGYTGDPGTSDATMATATRELTAASEDPGTFTLSSSQSWAANTIAIKGRSGVMNATVDYIKVTVRYTVNGILNWYTSAVGGTSVQSGSPFNPIGDPEVVAVYPALANSLTPGTYPFWAECSSVPGCRTLSNFTINPAPDAPVAGSNTYTYDNFEKTAEAIVGSGETVDWYDAPIGGNPIAAPAGTNAGTYTGYAETRIIATGCVSLTRTLVTLTIDKRPVTITADPDQTKVYGDTDPLAFTYTVSGDGLASGDAFSGALQRNPGEDVGSYLINIGDLTITNQLVNYTVTYISDSFSITVLPVTVTANAGQTKIYGAAEPVPYTYTSVPTGNLPNGIPVSFSGALTRVPGESVGSYAILQGTLANINYDITFVSDNFTITALPVTITVDPGQTKVYGELDPAEFTFTSVPAVGSILPDGSTVSFSGSLTRLPGEDVDSYEIQQGTLDNSNYDITFVPADFTITAMPITVTATAGQTKVYGAVNPVYTYTSVPTGTLLNGEVVSFTGALSRLPGEDVGSYAIQQGTLANANYIITFVPDNFTITAMPITVTADAGQTKVYGALNPLAYTYTSVPSGTLPNGDVVSFDGALTRVAGEGVGSYAIQQGTLANTNYTITFVPANFTITALPVTVTANAGQTKVYGSVNPASYTFTSSPAVGSTLANGDLVSFTGALSRTPGENVGSYAILQGTLGNANYDITFVSDDFTITALPVTVTADAGQTKVYGSLNPAIYTFVSSPAVGSTLSNGDLVSFSGALSRVAGEDVGSYAIQQGTLANSNYTITFIPANFTITAMPITVTANSGQTKVYGAADPLAYTYTSVPTGLLPNGETVSFMGALNRVAGESVGSYAIQQGTLANTNYTITFVPANFTITAMPITVTADAGQTKVYGAVDPLPFTYTSLPTGTLPNGDAVSFSGALSRVSGEGVGSYAIQQGTLANGNYTITFVPANFTITPLPVTVTADAGQTKVYGAVNPASYTFTSSPAVGSALANGDLVSFTGALTRVSGENVGNYAIQQGTLANSNYTITFVSADFTITAMPITVTADAGQTKVYGAANPLVYTYTSVPTGTLPNGDLVSFTGALTRLAGEDVGSYAIQQGTLANTNYTITFVSSDFTITAMPIIVTADAGQTKVYGAANPLAYTYTSVPTGTLPNGDVVSFTGAMSRLAGEDVGSYAIQQGTLANSNYIITFVSADFTITAMPITVTATAGQTKVYGAADPLVFTYTSVPAGLLPNGETVSFTGALSRVAGENVGSYAIQQGTLANGNYTITFVTANFTITPLPVTVTATAGQTKVYGSLNPASYTFTSSPAVGSALANGDVVSFTGVLTRVSGENVGNYAIQQGTLANSNYTITFVSADFAITALPVTVTATSGQTKVYGAVNPVYTYTSVPTGTLPNGDVVSFTGALTRVAGENVGSYAIQQGTLANTNYTITFVSADFTITGLPVTVTATAGQTKVYGAVDPLVYTYTSSPTGLLPNGETVSFTGALSRVAGENVGSYAIQQGTLANSNYTITFVPANFTITPLTVTVTATAGQTKVYGTVDPPAYTYASVPSGLLPNGATVSFTGALTRVAGENVGSYAIQIGTLSNSNYNIIFVPANFTITALAVTVTASPGQTKMYGNADPGAFSYTSVPAVGSILPNGTAVSFTGALTRAPGENAGAYAIQQGTLANSNYNISFVSSNFTITARLITVTANPQTKIYGTPDPLFTYQITSGTLVGTDAFSGSLTRAPGQNVGTYAILQGTLTLGGNYTITYVGANLTITSRLVTITADPKTKVYGTADPVLTYQITSGTLAGGDSFSGALTRDPGQNIGAYFIRQGTLALNSNYTLTYIGANLTITPRAITVTANAQTKVYGNDDPVLTYQITSGSLAGPDSFTGSLTRDAGENVGVYPIRRGSLALNSNYTLTYVGADLTITIRSITVTADPKTKIYGDSDPVLTYQITSGSLAGNGDAFSGSLTRDPGEDAGTYAITQGTLGLGSNYDLTYIGADLTIITSAITVTADNSAKVYGDPDNLTYQITSGSLYGTDTFTGSLSHDGGEDVGTHPITQGTLALSSNYTLTFIGATLTITPRPVTVTANTLSKVYGDSDPMLTYSVTSGSLALGDTFSGAMIREAGENYGDYTISQGDLALNSNYILTFVGANFTITPRPITVTADPKLKIYGETDPVLTYQITSGNLAGNGDAFTGALTRDPGEDVGIYAITIGTLSLSSNYTLTYVGADLNIVRSSVAITVAADPQTKVYGEADPELTYEIITGALIGTDTFTGELTREAGENVGTYAILQGTLALSANYDLVFTGADFTITSRPITVTADPKSKVFGESDPELTYEITSGELVANGDAFTGVLTRDPGEDVGVYAITQGTLSLGDNYDITFEEAVLNITAGFEMDAYPNPFSDHIYFEFDLNNDSEVLLEIYNIIGVKIATVFKGNLTADHYRFEFLPEYMSEGVVIYKLSINGHEMVVGKAIHKK